MIDNLKANQLQYQKDISILSFLLMEFQVSA